MSQALFLAIRSLLWHRGRATTVMASLSIVLWLPATVRLLLDQFRAEITARAQDTPLLIGARGSRLDLALHALYFESAVPDVIPVSEATRMVSLNAGLVVPMHVRFRTQSRPGADGAVIVGTVPEYFEFRQLTLAVGEPFALLGECTVGARIAELMHVGPGDALLSAPRNAMNLAGEYPLKMTVTGVLNWSNSPDDLAVFTDVRTAWVIEGIGHGHQQLSPATDRSLLLDATDSDTAAVGNDASLIANAGVLPYTEITPQNIASFHFHGDPETFPLTAIIVVPEDLKSQALILGEFADERTGPQCLKPPVVVAELLDVILRIEQFAWFCSLAAAGVTGMLILLVVNLSMKLRSAEMHTMFRLGCSRATIAKLYAAEQIVVLLAAIVLATGAAVMTSMMSGSLLRQLLF